MGTMPSLITSFTSVYPTVYLMQWSKKTSKLRVTGLWVTGEFPAQMTSNAENVSIWWRHNMGSSQCVAKKILITDNALTQVETFRTSPQEGFFVDCMQQSMCALSSVSNDETFSVRWQIQSKVALRKCRPCGRADYIKTWQCKGIISDVYMHLGLILLRLRLRQTQTQTQTEFIQQKYTSTISGSHEFLRNTNNTIVLINKQL